MMKHRKWLAVCIVVALGTNWAAAQSREELFNTLQQQDLWSREAAQTGQKVLSQYPPHLQMGGDVDLAYRYARAAIAVAYELAERQQKCHEALGVTGSYLQVFGRTPIRLGCAVDALYLRYLLRTNAPTQQLLQAARTCSQRAMMADSLPIIRGGPSGSEIEQTGPNGLINHIVDCYLRAGQPGEALEMLRRLPLFHPTLLDDGFYWQKVIDTHLRQDKPEMAIQANLLYLRICPFAQGSVNSALELLTGTLIGTGQGGKVGPFLRYLRSGEGENPLGDIEFPDFTTTEVNQMLASAGNDYSQCVLAYLYTNRIEQALQVAKAEAMHGQPVQGVRDIARCLKARDMHLVRANQFINWMRTGEGSNPLEEF